MLFSGSVKSITMQIIYFGMGILSSQGAVLGNFSPFGTSLISAVQYNYMWSSLAGTIVGYILPSLVDTPIRYIASVIAVACIRWTLNDLARIKMHSLYAPIISFLPIMSTGLAVGIVDNFSRITIIMIIMESLLSAAGAYFFTRTVRLMSGSRGISTFTQQEFACIAMSMCIGVLSFSNLEIAGISIGRIIAVLVILVCSQYAGVSGGSISGIAFGIMFSIASTHLSYLSASYAFAGLMAGLFSPFGKIGVAAAFILSNAIICLETGDTSLIMTNLYEVMASTIIFILIPAKLSNRLSNIFLLRKEHVKTDGLRNSIIMRLDFASNALLEVSNSIESISDKLNKLNSNDINAVYSKAVEKTCNRCGLKVFCLEKEYDNTMRYLNGVTNNLKSNGEVLKGDFEKKFINRCCKSQEMIDSINYYYDELISKEAAMRRMTQLRGIVSEQFLGIGNLLSDISLEFREYEKFNYTISDRLNTELKAFGILPVDVSCREDKYSRMLVEIEAVNSDKNKINKFDLSREISRICDRKMNIPAISYAEDKCRIQVSEKPNYNVDIAGYQHVCNNGNLCGDNYCYFDDGMGRIIVVLSDGMGTGGRAAVDAAMSTGIISKLVKAGIGFDCTLKIVNSALLSKSTEESLSTIDIACIDMFTANAKFMKAGAPVTFIKRGSNIVCINTPSLPAGILTDIKFEVSDLNLSEDDIILMISDGAIVSGDNWIEEMLQNFDGQDIKDLVKGVVSKAAKLRQSSHDDDISAIAIRLTKQ